MSLERWARLTQRLFESFYVAAQLIGRNLLRSKATSLKRLAERRTTQAARLYALVLGFPAARFTAIRGRDLLEEPSGL